MKNVLQKKLFVPIACTIIFALSSSFSYGNNVKQNVSYNLVFDILDKDHNGYVTNDEVRQLLPLVSVSYGVAYNFIDIFDINGDEQISEYEFTQEPGLQTLPNILAALQRLVDWSQP